MSADLAVLADLESCETVIERGLATFIDVGNALLRIRDDRLYRTGYDSFEDYCRDRWGFSRVRAHQLIAAADVIERVSTIVNTLLPATESQARELVGLPAEQAADAMRKAHEATNGKVTAAAIREAVRPAPIVDPAPAEPEGAAFPDVPDEAPDTGWIENGPDPWGDEITLTQEECEALEAAAHPEPPRTPIAPTVVPRPDPNVTAVLDADPAIQDATYLLKFSQAIGRAQEFARFDPERIGQIGADVDVESIAHLLKTVSAYLDRVRRARAGLRVLTGGRK